MSLHPKIEQAINGIDAAFFSSDSFYNRENLERIESMLVRWQKEVNDIKKNVLLFPTKSECDQFVKDHIEPKL